MKRPVIVTRANSTYHLFASGLRKLAELSPEGSAVRQRAEELERKYQRRAAEVVKHEDGK